MEETYVKPSGSVSVTRPELPKLEALIVTVSEAPLSTVEEEKDLVAPVVPGGVVGTAVGSSVGTAVGSSVGVGVAVTVTVSSPSVARLSLWESLTVPLNVWSPAVEDAVT